MKFRRMSLAACCLLMAAALSANPLQARADEASLVLGNEYGELMYAAQGEMLGVPDATASVGMLLTEDNNIIGHGTFATKVLEGFLPRLRLDIGARLYLAGLVEPDDDIIAIGFGASGRYRLPLEWLDVFERYPLYVAASFYLAPEITASGSNTDIVDIHVVRGELELGPNIDALVGLRTLDVDRDFGDDDIVDEKIYVGLRIRF